MKRPWRAYFYVNDNEEEPARPHGPSTYDVTRALRDAIVLQANQPHLTVFVQHERTGEQIPVRGFPDARYE